MWRGVTTFCALLLGCGEGAAPGNVGAGGSDGLPSPESILAPSAYDCSAEGPFEPPERPHSLDCFRDSSCSSPLVAAHRIATPFAPENSLSALRAAILLGVDVVETDVRLTADGQVVLIHDGDVDRTLEGSGEVSSFTLEELRALPMKSDGKPDGDFSCDRVPTLEEALDLAEGKIVVELEVKSTEAGVKAAEYVKSRGAYDYVFFLCGRSECEALRAAVPDVPIMSRPKEASAVAMELDYDPRPILVHIDAYESFLTEEILGAIRGAGAKAYANAFLGPDVQAFGSGVLDGYPKMYQQGLDVVQTELPHAALLALDRL